MMSQEAALIPEKAYDIEADWIMFSGCNYRCEYCFWPDEALNVRPSPPAQLEQLVGFFAGTGLRWQIHLTGGEPFLYPQFVELVQRLTENHLVSVNSNLSSERVVRFADSVNPATVSFVNCGLHVRQREIRSRAEDFIRKVRLLRAAGFRAFATYVFHPPSIDRAPGDFAAFAAEGVPLFPKAFRGSWEGKSYPAGYTEDQKALFMRLSAEAETAYADMWAAKRVPPTIDPLLDRDLVLHGIQDYRGRLCSAGRDFVRIRENGDVQRCGPSEVLGNIPEGTLQLKEEPSPCQDLECPYFCYKYLVPAAGSGRQAERDFLTTVRWLASGMARRWSGKH